MKVPLKISVKTAALTPRGGTQKNEQVAIEKPFKVLLNEEETAGAMILPTGLEEFGAGFLFGLGHITCREEVKEVWVCPEGRISVLADIPENRRPRGTWFSAGCEGAGKIPEALLKGSFSPLNECRISFPEIRRFLREFSACSSLGKETHCIHSCGFWSGGRLEAFHEDISHNNAIDKIIGEILLDRCSPSGALYTTGRLMSDTMLKCARIGIPIVMSRTAPSSLGLAIATRAGVTLAAYARPDKVNVFNRPDRITQEVAA